MTEFVATLIARPENAAALAEAVGRASAVVAARVTDTLAADEAIDLYFDAHRPQPAERDAVAHAIAGLPVDVVVQPVAYRRKKLLVADMDSTIIGQECIDELADFAGLKARVAAITERAMRGEIAFEPALRERVALLAGLPASTIDMVIAERIRLTPGAKTLVRTMRKHGAYTLLVSGGFTAFTDKVAAMAGFDETRANKLTVADGKLSGKVEEPILGQAAKLEAIEDAIVRRDIPDAETLAVGDGANDLAMIARAGLGVAFRAKPAVAAAAAARIEHTDLTALLYAQGYRQAEFVA